MRGQRVGRARLSRHKAILVNKAVQCRLSEEETALVYVFLSFLFDQIQLHSYFSASTIYCLFGEVSLSLSLSVCSVGRAAAAVSHAILYTARI